MLKCDFEVSGNDVLPELVDVQIEDGESFRMSIEYPWKPLKCNSCREISHSFKNCPHTFRKWVLKKSEVTNGNTAKETNDEGVSGQASLFVGSDRSSSYGTITDKTEIVTNPGILAEPKVESSKTVPNEEAISEDHLEVSVYFSR